MKEMVEQKAIDLLNKCDTVALSSINENGYPRVCVVSKLKTEGFHKLYFSTGTDSKKTGQFRSNPKASLVYYNVDDAVTLIGNVKIVDDSKVKEGIWQDWMINHFSGGASDPNYCVLEFTTNEATFCVDNQLETYTY